MQITVTIVGDSPHEIGKALRSVADAYDENPAAAVADATAASAPLASAAAMKPARAPRKAAEATPPATLPVAPARMDEARPDGAADAGTTDAEDDTLTVMTGAEAKLKALEILRDVYARPSGPAAVKALQKEMVGSGKFVDVPDDQGPELYTRATALADSTPAA